MLNQILSEITKDKHGVEIGGPSFHIGKIIYENASSLDNVVFTPFLIYTLEDLNRLLKEPFNSFNGITVTDK